jgi:hypothetical protein
VLPSKLLSDERWVRFVVLLLNLNDLNVTSTITTQQKIKADHLVKMLQHRFQQHLIHRIKDKSRRYHWSMLFAYSNLAICAACMVLCNHVADELCFLQDSDSLLPPNPYNFFQCARFPLREGAYLYYDRNKGSFIRSGKRRWWQREAWRRCTAQWRQHGGSSAEAAAVPPLPPP